MYQAALLSGTHDARLLVNFETTQSHIFRMHFAYYEYLTNFKSIASAYKLEVSHTRYSSSICDCSTFKDLYTTVAARWK